MKDKIVGEALFYSASTFFAKIFTFFRSIIVARFLGPSLYGLWNALSIILEYSRYSNLGVLNAMNREVPYYRGKKDNAKVHQIRNTALTMACIPSVLIGLALVVISIFMKGRVGYEWVLAIRVIAVLISMMQLYDFFTLLFRSNKEFKFLSKLQIIFSIIDLALVSVLVINFGFEGFLWAIVLTYIVVITYIVIKIYNVYRLRFYLNKNLLLNLMGIGIFITLIGVVINLRTTVDRLMIIKFLGVTQLGYFSLSFILMQFVFLIPSSISQIMYPRLAEKYGASNRDTSALRKSIEITTLVLVYSMPLLIGEVFLILPFCIKTILPQYVQGIVPAQITILGLFFFSAGIMAANFLVTTNKLRWYLWCSIIAVIFNIAIDYIFLKAGYGIEGVALGGIMITSFIYATFLLGSVTFHYLSDLRKTFFYLVKLYFPFFYTLIILFLIGYFKIALLLKMVIFAIFCIPLLWKLEKDTGTVRFVLETIINYKKG